MLIRHDRTDRDSLVDPCKWPAITTFFRGAGAGSLISSTWILTAAHVARHIPTDRPFSVEFVEQPYRIARVLLHPAYDPVWDEQSEDEINATIDIALVELETPVENVIPYEIYTGSDELGQEVLLLGSGQYGDGLRGVRGADRQLRRVTNIIDTVDERWLAFCFDEPPAGTALEGVCGGGDSGGPAFLREDARLLLAGISSWQQQGEKPLGVYGCIEHYARVSRFVDWIRTTCDLES